MNRKTIKSVLRKKIDTWIDSIDDADVKDLVSKNIIVTGGAIANLLLNENVKDYDIYFKTKETVVSIAKYYIKKYKEKHNVNLYLQHDEKSYLGMGTTPESNPDYERVKIYIPSQGVIENEVTETITDDIFEVLNEEQKNEGSTTQYNPVYFSSNAITLSGKIQLVIRFYGEPEEIHSNYDFVHCTNYWTSWDSSLVLRPDAIEAILTKQLLYIGSKYPVCSIIRTRKFIKRGWTCNAGQYIKMIFQCGTLDLNDIKVLEDQLVGVDSAYFDKLIESLSEHIKKHSDFKLSYGYLAEIIERIF